MLDPFASVGIIVCVITLPLLLVLGALYREIRVIHQVNSNLMDVKNEVIAQREALQVANALIARLNEIQART